MKHLRVIYDPKTGNHSVQVAEPILATGQNKVYVLTNAQVELLKLVNEISIRLAKEELKK